MNTYSWLELLFLFDNIKFRQRKNSVSPAARRVVLEFSYCLQLVLSIRKSNKNFESVIRLPTGRRWRRRKLWNRNPTETFWIFHCGWKWNDAYKICILQVAEATNKFRYFRIFKGITQHSAIYILISFILGSIEIVEIRDSEKGLSWK